jgi:putative ABC transport system permease protein
MRSKMLWKDAWQAITHSLGRYLAIIALIALGTFAFVGLKMTGPDMRATGNDFFTAHHLADVTVVSNYGLDAQDQHLIKQAAGVRQAEFGYFQDATVAHTKTTLRIFSQTKKLSTSEVIKGHLPRGSQELALSYLLAKQYHLGQTIHLQDATYLKHSQVKIVGFVKSSEYLDKHQIGQTNLGNGRLTGIAVASPVAFTSPVKQIGRVSFKNTSNLSLFSTSYRNRAYRDQQKLQKILNKQAANYPLSRQYTVQSREDNLGYATYRADSQKVEILASVFPVFLYAVAALVCLSTMTRFVEEERIKIGTLKGLGYSNAAIGLKFTLYSTSAALLGVILGGCLGYTFLPNMIIKAYLSTSTLGSNYELNFAWDPILISLLVALTSTTIVTWLTLWSTLRERPAALLLPKPPKKGSRILLEYITPLWRRLSFSAKVTARNAFRYKSRMLMTILGVAGCTGLLVMGFGIRDSLQGISHIQYQQIEKNDVIALENQTVTPAQTKSINQFMQTSAIQGSLPVRYEQLSKHQAKTGATQAITLIAPQNPHKLRQFINLRQRTDHKQLNLPKDGVIITEKLAQLLGLQTGDWLTLQSNGQPMRFKISGICETYINHYLFLSPAAYRKFMGKAYQPNAYLITMKRRSQVDHLSRQLVKLAGIQTVIANSANRQFLNSYTGSIDLVIVILIIISSLLAIVVIYNLTNINVAERVRELSTIKVLGFYDREVTMYIYRETIFLSLIGILVGYVFGWWLHHFIIVNLPPDQAMFDPKMYPLNFLLSALIPAIITGLMAIWVHHHLQKINMLDALASLD